VHQPTSVLAGLLPVTYKLGRSPSHSHAMYAISYGYRLQLHSMGPVLQPRQKTKSTKNLGKKHEDSRTVVLVNSKSIKGWSNSEPTQNSAHIFTSQNNVSQQGFSYSSS